MNQDEENTEAVVLEPIDTGFAQYQYFLYILDLAKARKRWEAQAEEYQKWLIEEKPSFATEEENRLREQIASLLDINEKLQDKLVEAMAREDNAFNRLETMTEQEDLYHSHFIDQRERAHDYEEQVAALIASLPRCDLCLNPATRSSNSGKDKRCDGHQELKAGIIFGLGKVICPEYEGAEPLRKLMAMLKKEGY